MICIREQEEEGYDRDLGIDGMIILKYMLQNSNVKTENRPTMLGVHVINTAVKTVMKFYVLQREH